MLSASQVHCCISWLRSSWTSTAFPVMNSLNKAECCCFSLDWRLRTMTSRTESLISLSEGRPPRERATSSTNGINTNSGVSNPDLTNLRNFLPRGWPVAAALEIWNITVAFDCKISLRDEPDAVIKIKIRQIRAKLSFNCFISIYQ